MQQFRELYLSRRSFLYFHCNGTENGCVASHKGFSPCITCGANFRSVPGRQARFSSLEKFLNEIGLTQAAERDAASVSTVNGC
jgi:hypothetical protein